VFKFYFQAARRHDAFRHVKLDVVSVSNIEKIYRYVDKCEHTGLYRYVDKCEHTGFILLVAAEILFIPPGRLGLCGQNKM
jgi:hypothetical protein